jgi:hypothetical protein
MIWSSSRTLSLGPTAVLWLAKPVDDTEAAGEFALIADRPA